MQKDTLNESLQKNPIHEIIPRGSCSRHDAFRVKTLLHAQVAAREFCAESRVTGQVRDTPL